MKKLTKYYFHIHHEVLVEALTEPLKNRIKYIKENKPKDEIELRLRLIKPVKGKLPSEFIKADQAWEKAYQAQIKADQARAKAHQARDKAEQANQAWEEAYQAQIKADQARVKAYQAWGKTNQADQAWEESYQARGKANQAWDKADQAWEKAEQALVKALKDNTPALEKLHKVECGCGYDFIRKTIFTEKNGLER